MRIILNIFSFEVLARDRFSNVNGDLKRNSNGCKWDERTHASPILCLHIYNIKVQSRINNALINILCFPAKLQWRNYECLEWYEIDGDRAMIVNVNISI